MPISKEKRGRALRNALLGNPLFPCVIAAMLGIGMVDASLAIVLIPIALLGLLVGGWLGRNDRLLVTLALGVSISLGGFAFLHHLRLQKIESFPLASALHDLESIEVAGRGWFSERPQPGERSTSGILHLEALVIRGVEIPCDHRVPVWIAGRTEGFHYGTQIRFSGNLSPLESASSPGGFDPARFYYRESGSLGRLEIRAGDELAILEETRGHPLVAFANSTRDRLERALLHEVEAGEEPYARLITAMSLGARENSPEDLEEYFRLSGTMHIFAVSGLHVGILAGLFLGLFLAVGIPRRWAILILIPILLFYAVMTGLRPSAIRAAVMLSIFLGAFVVKEKPRPLNHLAFAALFLLLFDTQQLFLPGFQLSFAVLLSITLLASPMQRWTAGPWLSDPFLPKSLHSPLRRAKDHLVGTLTAALAVSLVSWLGSLGLLVWHFQSFSPIGIVANLFLVPLVGVIVTLALASLVGYGLQLGWLAGFLNQLNILVAIGLTSMAQFFAELPGAHRHTGRGVLPETTEQTLTLDVMGARGEMATLWGWPGTAGEDRRYWIIDPGGTFTYQQEMLPLLRSRSVNRIEALGLTHGDIGHIGAAPIVMTQFHPSLFLEPEGPNRSTVYPEIRGILEANRIESLTLSAGMRLRPAPNSGPEEPILQILSPGPETPNRVADDRALVLRLEWGEMSVLLTSDIGFATEKALLEKGMLLQSDLWIRGQHRETVSGMPAFVEAVDAQLVLSTAAEFPSFESVPESFRTQLDEKGTPLLTLDETGVVSIEIETHQIRIRSHQDGSNRQISPRN